MPVTKNKLLRLQTILSMMRKNSYPNFTSFLQEMQKQDIAGTFKISRKTFGRDIIDLRDEFHAPIQYSTIEKGYYLTNNEWYSEELMVEPFEMKAALLGERVASSIFPEPLASEIRTAVNSLLMKNDSGLDENAQINSLKIVTENFFPNITPEIFKIAYNSWEQRNTIELSYLSLRDKLSKKIFEPYVFAWSGGNWYIKGRLLREDETIFYEPKIQVLALHRIQDIKMLQSDFIPEQNLMKTLDNNSLFDFQKLPEAIIEFPLPDCKVSIERFKNQSDTIIVNETNNAVTIKFMNITEYQIMDIFWDELGDAKIISPNSIREKVINIAKKVFEKHNI